MNWKFWIAPVAGVIQAAFAILQFFGISASSVKIPTSTTSVMTVLMVLTWLGVALNYYLRRPSQLTPAPSAPPSTEELRKAELARNLLRMAENDSQNMWQRIHVYWNGVSTDAHLDAVNPYVDLTVGFVNATVFEVFPDHIEGRISYLNDPLRDAPEFLDLTKGNHGEGFRIALRQWLLPETARQMSQSLPVILKTGYLAVFFRYIDQNGEIRLLRYAFPDEIFRIEPPQLPTKVPAKEKERDPIPLSRSVHVSAITVDFRRLPADSLLDISVMAFTGALDPISIDPHIDGVLRVFWEVPEGHEKQDWVLTLTPQILKGESQLDHLPRGTEFRIRFLQPISADKANDIWAAFCSYKKIDLSFANLSIWVWRDGQETQKERFPLWYGISCWKLSDGNVFQTRVINAFAEIAIPAGRVSSLT